MNKKILPLFLLMLCSLTLSAQSSQTEQALMKADKQFFIENKGQWPNEVLYLSRIGGLDVWITKTGVNYTFYKIEKQVSNIASDLPKGKYDLDELENATILGHRVIAEYVGANLNPTREGKQKQEGYNNYLIGNDPSKHASFVGLYKEAEVKNVYDGIDIRYYFDQGKLRYDYIVQPNADPSQIQLRLQGQDDAYLKGKDIAFTTRFGEVQLSDLQTYQEGKTIRSRFVKNENTWKISVDSYDKSKQLIIDPLIYSTYIGGMSAEYGRGIALDGDGYTYVTGWSSNLGYDITIGAFQTSLEGNLDALVTKLNPTGNSLVYSTYLGGSSWEYGEAIDIDGSGHAYITGRTNSSDYDVTAEVFQTTYEGSIDAFVSKLNPTGTSLVYSTYIGGAASDAGVGIAVDGAGYAYITGHTNSLNYDITAGAFQTTNEGNDDVIVTKLNPAGTGLVYSTFIGGNNRDNAFDIEIDANEEAYITGYTQSTDFDITAGVFQTTKEGYEDAFVLKLNSNGSNLIFSTLIGGSSGDRGHSIAIDGSGYIYITGRTESSDYDITPGAYQTTYGGGYADIIVTKLNSTGTALVYSTFIGGSEEDYGAYSIDVDINGYAYIAGHTESIDFDIVTGAFQSTYGGGVRDVFITKLNPMGSGLVYSTYLGGSLQDISFGIIVDGSGHAYIVGETESTNFDITSGAYQTFHQGLREIFVTKIDFSAANNVLNQTNHSFNYLLFPNPTQNAFTIQSEKGGIFDLIDIAGRVLNSYEVKSSYYVIQEQLPSGVYYIRERKSGSAMKLMVHKE